MQNRISLTISDFNIFHFGDLLFSEPFRLTNQDLYAKIPSEMKQFTQNTSNHEGVERDLWRFEPGENAWKFLSRANNKLENTSNALSSLFLQWARLLRQQIDRAEENALFL